MKSGTRLHRIIRCHFLKFFLLLFCSGSGALLHAQTTLSVGDIAIIQINTDISSSGATGNSFSFVCWKPLTAGTVIKFTNNTFNNPSATSTAGTWDAQTCIESWTNTGGTIAAGTVITITSTATPTSNPTASLGAVTVDNTITDGSNGDQIYPSDGGGVIFVYQGSFSGNSGSATFSGTMLFGIVYQGGVEAVVNGWNNNSSYLPTDLSAPTANIQVVGAANTWYEGQYSGGRNSEPAFSDYQADVTNLSNWTASAINTNPINGASFGLLSAVAPTIQATNVTFPGTSNTQVTVDWTDGNGADRAVFMEAGTAGTPAPVTGTTYTGNAAFGSGTEIGTSGWYCVYNGTGNTVTVTGLTANQTYNIMVVEYNGGAPIQEYNTSTATGNPATVVAAPPAVGTSLAIGQMAIIGFGTEGGTSTAGFSFVTWQALGPNTIIKFTNNGFNTSGLSTITGHAAVGHEISQWENTTGTTIAAGTVITIVGSTASPVGTVTALGPSAGGDDDYLYPSTTGGYIFAYQGNDFNSATSPATFFGTILFGIDYEGSVETTNTGFLTTGTINDPITTYRPSELSAANGSIYIGGAAAGGQYPLPRNNKPALSDYVSLVTNAANWIPVTGSSTIALSATPFTAAPPAASVVSGSTTICAGSPATVSVALTGTAPWNLTYTNGTTPVPITGITASPYTFSVSPTTTTTYTVSALTDANGAATAGNMTGSAVITVNPLPTAVVSGSATVCNGSSATVSVALTGTAPWSLTYTSGGTPVSVTGIAASPYTFSVSPSVTTTYTVTALSDASCTALPGGITGSATVTAGVAPTAAVSGSATICNGGSATVSVALTGTGPWNLTYTDGTTPVSVTGIAASPYTFSVSPSATTTYTVTALSDASCTALAGGITGSALITVNPRPTAVVSGSATICNGGPATVSVALTGTGPWNLTYTDGTTPVSVTGITASPFTFNVTPSLTTTYTVTAVSDAGCTAQAGDITGSALITVNPLPTAVVSGSSTICNGGSATVSIALTGTAPWNLTYTDGTAPVSVPGITASPYTFNVTPSTATTYTATALTAAGCTAQAGGITGSALITVNQRPTAVVSGSATICNGGSATVSVALTGMGPWNLTYTDGTTPVSVPGIATSPYTFSVSPSLTTTYTVTAVSDAGCTGQAGDITGSALITVNPRPTAAVSGSATICNGGSATVSVALTGTAPWSLTYTSGGTPVSVPGITASPYTFSVSPSATTTYTVTAVSDAGCTGQAGDITGSATVLVNPRPTAVVSGSTTICNGGSAPVSVALTGTGPWNLTYTDGTTPVSVTGITASPYTFSVSPSATTTYTVTAVSDAGCTGQAGDITGSATVSVSPRPTAAVSGSATICNGGSATVSVALTGTGPWNLTYTDGTTPVSVTGITSSPYIFSVSPSLTTTYTVTAVSDAGCTGQAGDITGSATVSVSPRPTAAVSGSATICNGGSATVSVALTGTGPWNLTYTDGTTPVSVTGVATSPYTFNVSPSATTTYTVTAVSDAGCTGQGGDITGSALITVNPRPTATVSGSTGICNGGTATVSVALTGTAPWTMNIAYGGNNTIVGPVTTSPYTFTADPTKAMTYTVSSLTDAGCTAQAGDLTGSAVITIAPRPTAVVSGSVTICNGGSTAVSVALTGTGPWNLTYTDGTTPVSVTGVATSPYTFNVSPSATTTYTVTAVSDAGCTGQAGDITGSALITVNPRPTAAVSGSATICNGGSATVSVTLTGTGPWNLTYTSGGTPVSVTGITASPYIFSVSPSATTTYTVTAVSDAGCTGQAGDITGLATVSVNPRPTAVVSGSTTICNGSSATVSVTLTGTGPWNLTYTSGTTPVSVTGITASPYTFSVSPSATTTYTVTAVSDAGCTGQAGDITGSALITVSPRPTAMVSGSSAICDGGTTTVSVALTGTGPWNLTYTSGATPVSVTGITASPYTFSVSPSATTTYTVTAVSDAGCSAQAGDITGSATVTVNPLPTIPVITTGSSVICSGATVTLTSSAATGNQWYENGGMIAGQTGTTYAAADAGTYLVTVTSGAGCTASSSSTVLTANTVPQAPVFDVFTAIANGGQTDIPYSVVSDANTTSYQWSYSGTGVTINGTASAVTLDFVGNASSGNLQVIAVNGCGNSPAASQAITVRDEPVQFSSFTVTRQGATSLLDWTTAFEYNLDHFEIDHSTDSTHFTALANVPATGNSNVPNAYSYVHSKPAAGWNEYQIKGVAKDGTTVLSALQSVFFDPYDLRPLTIYPNPATSTVHVAFVGRQPLQDPAASVSIWDLTGRQVLVQAVSGYQNDVELNVSGLARGVYIIVIRYAQGEVDTAKLLKE